MVPLELGDHEHQDSDDFRVGQMIFAQSVQDGIVHGAIQLGSPRRGHFCFAFSVRSRT